MTIYSIAMDWNQIPDENSTGNIIQQGGFLCPSKRNFGLR